jgi:hypothetical protein
MGKKRGTPDNIDYLFERDIVNEEDYVDFWSEYWQRNKKGRRDLEKEYVDRYNQTEAEFGKQGKAETIVYRNQAEATRQADSLNDLGIGKYRVSRRNAYGRFSKRGTYYQAIKQATRKKK